jgi:hypothetical protein
MRLRTKPNSVSEADGKGDLDFLEADGAEHLEHAHLLFGIHRLEKRLVAVAEIGAHPDRRLFDDAASASCGRRGLPGEKRGTWCWGLQHDGWLLNCIDWMANFREKRPAGACVVISFEYCCLIAFEIA